MKKCLPFFLFSFSWWCSAFSQANVYHPMRIDSGEWRTDNFEGYCFGLCDMWRYYIVGDTTINGLHYRKIKVDIKNYPNGGWYGLYIGAVREDTIAKQVYYFAGSSPDEKLLYDFNLQVGDLYPNTWQHTSDDSMWIVSIDSFLVGDEYHKKFNLSEAYAFSVSIVEGMGSLSGLLEPIYSLMGLEGDFSILKCYKVNSQIEYVDTFYSFPTCDLPTATNQVRPDNSDPVILPNPSNGFISLYFNSNFSYGEISVFNILGGKVFEKAFTGNQHKQNLDLRNLPKGIYTVLIQLKDRVVQKELILQ